MDLHDRVHSGIRARAAAVRERGPVLRAALHDMYPRAQQTQLRQAEGLADAGVLIQRLASQGVVVGAYGLPQRLTFSHVEHLSHSEHLAFFSSHGLQQSSARNPAHRVSASIAALMVFNNIRALLLIGKCRFGISSLGRRAE